MSYQPTLVDTAISGSSRTILRCEGLSIAPNGIEAATLDSRGMIFSSLGTISFSADGIAVLQNAAGTDFTRLCFGGTTASFPALRRNGANLTAVAADNSVAVNITAAIFSGSGFTNSVTSRVLISGAAPTISSGFGSSPSIAATNGAAAFTINVGTGGSASSGVIGLPTATTGWIVWVQNFTAQAAGRAAMSTTAGVTLQTGSTTTTATITNLNLATGGAVAWTASDVLLVTAFAY